MCDPDRSKARGKRRATRAAWRFVFLTVGLWLSMPTHAGAQGTGRALDIDASARSSGMGGASTAVFWGGAPSYWANPALTPYRRGVTYERMRVQLVPDLAKDVVFTARAWTVGLGGLGILSSGQPSMRLGPTRLDYGEAEGTDPAGNPTGTFGSGETIRASGFSGSAVELARSVAALAGGELPGWADYADVSFGVNSREIEIVLAPGSLVRADATARDLGWLVRVTPLNRSAGPNGEEVPLRVDVAYAYAVLGYNDGSAKFTNENQASPLSRHKRHGAAARLSIGHPDDVAAWLGGAGLGWLSDGHEAPFSVGVAWDRVRTSAGGDETRAYSTSGVGIEGSVAGLLILRLGHHTDRVGDIDGPTFGVGVAIPWRDVVGARYDFASFPQARGLDAVHRHSFAFFLHPLSMVQWLRRRS